MGLDINTEKGQKSLEDERHVQNLIKDYWNLQIVETPKESSAVCDGFLVRDNNLLAVFETKCRYDMTYDKLLERGSWLITHDKIWGCQKISEFLQIPFIGFLYLAPKYSDERVLLFWKITNNMGKYLFEFDVQEEETQRTINGGKTSRKNAYLPVEQSQFVNKIL